MRLIINKHEEPNKQEMKSWFYTRTLNHINLVKKYGQKLIDSDLLTFSGKEIFKRNLQEHDSSKLREPELTPYIYLSYKYKKEAEGCEVVIDNELEQAIYAATLYHVRTNKHHPEYWSTQNEVINKNNRDGIPKEIVDATKMQKLYIFEMCCDWCAMSEEKNNSPFDWADKMIGQRWKFTPKQNKWIYDCLQTIWN